MENKTQDVPKKCFCVRCFQPIDENDKVEIDGQNFHRMCGTCCICRSIPTKLKMFYGHVFCEECFKNFVLARFRGENPQVHTDSWWMQFAPNVKAQDTTSQAQAAPAPEAPAAPKSDAQAPRPDEPAPEKRCICARCLQAVTDADKVEIGGQTFHCCCARCCSCHQVPKDNIKIYCGQVFCEACFNYHILNRNRDNPTEFFKSCFEQWKSNPQFAENMKMFMESSASAHSPLVFMAPPYRVSAEREGVDAKSATPSLEPWEVDSEVSYPDSTAKSATEAAAEKIEKLTKYLRETPDNTETPKKWKSIRDAPLVEVGQRPIVSSKLSCPKCLWQSGTIYVNRG